MHRTRFGTPAELADHTAPTARAIRITAGTNAFPIGKIKSLETIGRAPRACTPPSRPAVRLAPIPAAPGRWTLSAGSGSYRRLHRDFPASA